MILRAGILYDGTLEPPKRNVDVAIDDGRIAEIRAAGGECDLEAACVTPGLVNAHAHVEASGEPDMMGMIRSTTPNQRLLRAVENARKSVKAGRHDHPRRRQLELRSPPTCAMRSRKAGFRDRACALRVRCSA